MKILLNSNENIKVRLDGDITFLEYSWFVKPLSDLLKNFNNTESYFEKIFNLLYEIKIWAKRKKAEFKLTSDVLFETTFYFFCKKREYER